MLKSETVHLSGNSPNRRGSSSWSGLRSISGRPILCKGRSARAVGDDGECSRFPSLANLRFFVILTRSLDPTLLISNIGQDHRISLRYDLERAVPLASTGVGRRNDRVLRFLAEVVFQDSRAREFGIVVGILHLVTDLDKLIIERFETFADSISYGFGDLLLDQTRGERSECLVKKIVLAVTNGELERVDFDFNALDFEDIAAHLSSRSVQSLGMELDESSDSTTAKEDVRKTSIFDLGEPALLTVVESNITHVGLHLR